MSSFSPVFWLGQAGPLILASLGFIIPSPARPNGWDTDSQGYSSFQARLWPCSGQAVLACWPKVLFPKFFRPGFDPVYPDLAELLMQGLNKPDLMARDTPNFRPRFGLILDVPISPAGSRFTGIFTPWPQWIWLLDWALILDCFHEASWAPDTKDSLEAS